jgi:hypothetical protein
MSKGIDEDGRGENPIYGVELREQVGGAEVAIFSINRDAEDDGTASDVWSARFGSVEAARMIVQVMMRHPSRWGSWVRMARILGRDFLTGVIEAEVIGAARLIDEEAAWTPGEEGRATIRSAGTVRVSLVLKGPPRIVAIRQGRTFMILTLETILEACRVWDWVRWQADAFDDWFTLARINGATALEVWILNAMRVDEAEAKAAGLAGDGPRPLQYWRPAGRQYCRD